MKNDNCNYGGQAIIEGVMMRSPLKYAIAVRKPDNEIILKTGKLKSLSNRLKILSGQTYGDQSNFDVTSIVEGDILSIDVDQVGNIAPGGDITAQLKIQI